MSTQLSKESISEWLEKCDYLKCSDAHKQELVKFSSERLYSALRKLPVSGHIFDLAPTEYADLGFSLLQHHFEISVTDGVEAEDAKLYKQNIRGKDVRHVNGYLSMMMRTVARELAGPEYVFDGIHNADGGKAACGDHPVVTVNQEIIDRCGDSGDSDDTSNEMPSLSGEVGSVTDWDPDADVYGVEPSAKNDLSNDRDIVTKVAADAELEKRAESFGSEKIKQIRKIRNCGACYYILTMFNGDYKGILGKTAFYDGAKEIKEIILSGDRSLELKRKIALLIQSFFEKDWWNDPSNASIVEKSKKNGMKCGNYPSRLLMVSEDYHD